MVLEYLARLLGIKIIFLVSSAARNGHMNKCWLIGCPAVWNTDVLLDHMDKCNI